MKIISFNNCPICKDDEETITHFSTVLLFFAYAMWTISFFVDPDCQWLLIGFLFFILLDYML